MQRCVVVVAFCVITSYNLHLGISKDLPNLFIYPLDYVKADAPRRNQSGQMTCTVKINLEIWAIDEISLQTQALEVDLIVTVVWEDHRLTLSPNISSQSTWPVINDNEAKQIWKPTILFRNCKGCSPISLSESENIYVNKVTGVILTQVRLLQKFTCAIDLRAYPMDIQFCQIQLYTYEDLEDAIQLRHRYPNTEVNTNSNLTLAEYYIHPIIKTLCVVEDAEGDVFSCLELRIRLDHLITYHLITSYGPTSFIVILSWISFWLPIELAPPRVALGLTSLLTLATRLDQAQKNLPSVSYAKAIDIWMFACIVLVSSSLCEFAVSHYFYDLRKTKAKLDSKITKVRPVPQNQLVHSVVRARRHSSDQTDSSASTRLDRLSRIIFPLSFLLFNIVYWSYYLTYYN